jgi:Helix-turn-helix domain
MLRELNVVEQRYRAVLEVLSGIPVIEVAERYGVARQTVHRCIARYRADRIAGLADRSHAPKRHQTMASSSPDASASLARLRCCSSGSARPAGPPPLPPPAGAVVEVERTVSASGNISIGDHVISAGVPLAGQRITVRLDGPVAHILSGGILVRTVACPVAEHARARLRGARPGTAGPPQLPESQLVRRRVSARGAIMIGGQRIQAGLPHAGKTAEIAIETDIYQITVEDRIALTAPRKTTRDIKRHKASNYSTASSRLAGSEPAASRGASAVPDCSHRAHAQEAGSQ